MAIKGIDISKWQGAIDFQKVKNSGIEFVIIRAGYGTRGKDEFFESNYKKAKAAGLHVGAYWYSYANGFKEADEEADAFLRALFGKQFDYPVYLDMEERSQLQAGVDFCSGLIKTFCGKLEAAGYFAGFYTSSSYARAVVKDVIRKRYSFWCAQWAASCSFAGSCGIWQYSSKGIVPGINGRVDLDYAYQDFPSIIVNAGFNGYKKTAHVVTPTKNVTDLANEVLAGTWGNGDDRKQRLTAAGYDYAAVQAEVNRLAAPAATYYTVKKGDTLSAIAARYGTSASVIQKLNPALIKNINKIQVGWKIRVK
ncbi:MAG: LysM peptidoglycan-binding domain-containing protein [Lachnospiraceae bacterium]|jgi:GH25 family lysozyme M1 (1,4-beta-N-acetylmuramidase)|nr:LysM peptidoglycan-binding domain-containing protein [Lachnospiraceae bacterium]MCH4067206.1 LysM peptidoglycan-binding domain-containing protein [Lachnospiraceae bacterium]MCH4113232.1 LysM peptidoglycan-binding domain-containing protein [Lachnospiraceae bacterium]